MSERNDYFVRIDASLVGREAGGSAAARAKELRANRRLGSLVDRALRRRTDERAWRRGASGERITAWFLGRLPDGWHVFHDVPVGDRGANIDHVVVGPAGVFTLNTKNVSGKVWLAPRTLLLNGRGTDYLPKAAREAQRASRLLTRALGRTPPVTGVLAILADHWTLKARPSDVHVDTPRGVKRWLLDRPTTLTPREVSEIAAVVANPSTWV